ncbi:MAG TPA: NYN domain-containing protein [Oligoflexia bacterium]|nr:NYN domain-containing protein [Oligoflexia bacterium]HMR24403.1 NYN domain-containing protein [Oligoflexia bacterium]
MKIIIDGYNLMFCGGFQDRDDLIETLFNYKNSTQHQHSFLVVFDGTHQGTFSGDRDFYKGLEIVYTPITEIADDWIADYLNTHKHKSASFLVVSSDRKVQQASQSISCDWISSEDFSKRIQQKTETSFADLLKQGEWNEGRENLNELYKQKSKKGNPRKLSKKERQKRKKFKKL